MMMYDTFERSEWMENVLPRVEAPLPFRHPPPSFSHHPGGGPASYMGGAGAYSAHGAGPMSLPPYSNPPPPSRHAYNTPWVTRVSFLCYCI